MKNTYFLLILGITLGFLLGCMLVLKVEDNTMNQAFNSLDTCWDKVINESVDKTCILLENGTVHSIFLKDYGLTCKDYGLVEEKEFWNSLTINPNFAKESKEVKHE